MSQIVELKIMISDLESLIRRFIATNDPRLGHAMCLLAKLKNAYIDTLEAKLYASKNEAA